MAYRTPLTVKKLKLGPPTGTGQESLYLKSLGEKQTPVTVKLLGGECFRGWIEYYDQNMIRLTRQDAPNLFIYKHDILFIAEESAGRGRL
jgi:host factor-I protein